MGLFVIITKWDNFLLLQSETIIITKWDGFFYYKLGQFHEKVKRVLQSGAVLLQSRTGITKWDNYYKVVLSRCQLGVK